MTIRTTPNIMIAFTPDSVSRPAKTPSGNTPAGYEPEQDSHDRDHYQNMKKSTHCVAAKHAQRPHHQQNQCHCPEHFASYAAVVPRFSYPMLSNQHLQFCFNQFVSPGLDCLDCLQADPGKVRDFFG
jgi:hypothetical protein